MSLIRNHLPSPIEYVASQGYPVRERGGKWRTCVCFNCGHSRMRVNGETGAFVCMSGCGARGGDVVAMQMAIHGQDFVTACKALGAWQDDPKDDKTPRRRPLPPDERRALHETFALPGVQRAALEYYRCNLGGLVRGGDARRSLDAASQRCSVPTLAMTGERDGCVDTRVFDHGDWRTDYLGPARLVRVTGAGHFLHQEKPQQVNAELLDWLRQHGGG